MNRLKTKNFYRAACCILSIICLLIFIQVNYLDERDKKDPKYETYTVMIYNSGTFMYEVYECKMLVDGGLRGSIAYDTDHCAVLQEMKFIKYVSRYEIDDNP